MTVIVIFPSFDRIVNKMKLVDILNYQYNVYVLLLRVRLSRPYTNGKHVVLVISFRARAEVVGGGGSVNV